MRLKRRKISGYLFIAPAMLFLIFMTVYPLFRIGYLSFFDYTVRTGESTFVGLKHFIRLFQDQMFWNSIKNTVIFALTRTFIHIPMGLVLALLLNYTWPKLWLRGLFRAFLILPWLFSNAVAALIWALILHPFGILNAFLFKLGAIQAPISLLGMPESALITLIMEVVWKTFPFPMVMLLGGLQAIPDELYEAAQLDGASHWRTIRYITLPLLLPVLLTTSLLELIWSFNQFDVVKLMTGGGPLQSTEVLSFRIYDTAFSNLDYGYGSVLSLAGFMLLMIFVVIYIRNYTRVGSYG
jgi:multiple sugar transport system permease protein